VPTPYPILEDVVEAARIRLNDAIIPGGDILTDTNSFTAPYINLAWQKLQQLLVSLGYVTLVDQLNILALPASASLDPAVQVSLSWTGYNDGSTTNTGILLPQTLIRPLRLWERPAGAGNFINMDEILRGLNAFAKRPWNQLWEWRADALVMPGATAATDLRIRYAKYLADFVPNSTVAFSTQQVPIMRSTDALAGFIAYEMSGSRGDVDSPALLKNATDDAMLIVGLDSSEGRATTKTSERGKMSAGTGAQ
jgi:hypothetical protein